nr:ribonuclease H-like domain-containing protein [Tanacetum cinerariifolium]
MGPTANWKFLTASRNFPTGSTKSPTADMGMKGKAGSSQNKIDDKGYWNSGCSRHMTGNISYLSDYEPFDGGYVSFGQGGCKITGIGTIKTNKLEFKNVNFVKDLKYNLFSVSQICDNKNSVLFTDSECIVLGIDFKLLDDANILLRTPRQHNMYSINLNNIVPHRDLTCLVAKASADECMLWYRRLGHLNFKTMNKLGELFGISGKHNVSQMISQDMLIDFYQIVLWIFMEILQRLTNCGFSWSYKAVKDQTMALQPHSSEVEIQDPMLDHQDKFMMKAQGKGSGTPTEPHHTPSLEAQPSSHTHISSPTLPTVTTIPTVTPSETTPLTEYTRRARIAQSLALPPVADEPASPMRDVSQDHDRANIAKTSTLPHEATSRVTSLAANEAQALEIIELKARVKFLEDKQGEGINLSRDNAPIKGGRLDEGEVATERVSDDTEQIRRDEGEVAAERVSDDTEEKATVLITMDVASVLLSGGVQVGPNAAAVTTASTTISTASTTISTATPIFATATTVTSYTRRKGKEKMVETHTPKKKKILQEQTDIQFARELEKESNETIAKHLEEYEQASAELIIGERIELISELVKYQDHHSKILQYQDQQRKTMNKKQKRDFYMAVIRNNLVWKQMEDFIHMGSNEEGKRIKRKGLNLEQKSAKNQKTSKEVPEEAMSPEEVTKENVKEMMQLVLIEEVYAKALQVKHPIID